MNEIVAEDSEGASQLTDDSDHTLISGYSMGGLFACYAAWIRPHVHSYETRRFARFQKCFSPVIQMIGRAACSSSSFWWPRFQSVEGDYNYYGQFAFLNETLYTHLEDRPKQKILIDVGELEEGDYTHVRFPEKKNTHKRV